MEKKWPPVKECAQYEYGMLAQYLQKFDWEDDEGDETIYEESSDEDEDGTRRSYPFKPSSLRAFLHRVRTTRGYGVDKGVPGFMRSPFWPVASKDIPMYQDMLNTSIEVAINHISSKTGKVYKHVDTLKVVDSPNRVLLLTFTAQETAARFREKKKKKIPERKMKQKPEKEKKEAAAIGAEQTFLASVYAPTAASPLEDYKLLECFLKPEGPAPWTYIELYPKC